MDPLLDEFEEGGGGGDFTAAAETAVDGGYDEGPSMDELGYQGYGDEPTGPAQAAEFAQPEQQQFDPEQAFNAMAQYMHDMEQRYNQMLSQQQGGQEEADNLLYDGQGNAFEVNQFGQLIPVEVEEEQPDIEALVQQHVQQAMAPFSPVLGQVSEREGQAMADQAIREVESRNGQLTEQTRTAAIEHATALFRANPQADPMDVLEQSHAMFHQLEQQATHQGAQTYQQSLQRGQAEGGQPPMAAAATAGQGIPEHIQVGSQEYWAYLTNRHLQAHRPQQVLPGGN